MPDNVHVFKASYDLQSKVGKGPLDEDTVRRCQAVLDREASGFEDLAGDILDRLELAIEKARLGKHNENDLIEAMTQPVMELKANARMFKYGLVSSLANIMLGFLESIEKLDKDAIEIVSAHQKTLHAIISREMKGDGGEYGVLLEKELRDAIRRYFSKR
ncbi:MAG: hypothetical protein CMH28_00885 [Micavibrio sp.]|nr:hypothetical protein [Micavibrio sp.]|tara:strand:+ start:190 stop:669 length:480 start_codon:yes stop_codon:yes gene_type:complete